MDAAGGERPEQPGHRIDGLDRDVVVPDELREAIGDLVEDRPRVQRRQDRFGDLEEAALVDELALERIRLGAEARRRVGRREGLGGEARVDDEEPQVVVAELVEPELREHEDAEDLVLERHRREQHRLVEVVLGACDRVRPRVLRRVGQVLGEPMLGDPAGDALAELAP